MTKFLMKRKDDEQDGPGSLSRLELSNIILGQTVFRELNQAVVM